MVGATVRSVLIIRPHRKEIEMKRSLRTTAVLTLALNGCVEAQEHSVIALSHSDFTAYELDPATGDILNSFVAKDQPHEGVVSRDGRTLYAAVPQAAHVVIIDLETWRETGRIESEYFQRAPEERSGPDGSVTINTSASPHGIALNSAGTRLYIGTERSEVPGIIVYDIEAGRVTKKIDLLLEGGHFLAIDEQTDKLYYPHRADNRVVVIDTKTDEIIKIIPVEGGPVGVGFTPDGEAWIHSDYDGLVTVIDIETDEIVSVIQTEGSGAGRMAVSPDGRYAASTHGDTEDVAIINTRTREVAATVHLGPGPGFPVFSPGSDKLYVMNSRGGDVVVVDMATMSEVGRHEVGVNPFGGTLRPLGRR
jgi:YVTN family beta-propeller protein